MSLIARLFRRVGLRGNRLLWVGLGIVGVVVVLTLIANFLPLRKPTDYVEGARLVPPNAQYWFGTDHLEQDVFSRVIYGARVPLLVAFISVLLSVSLGTTLGWVSGYFGGILDRAMSLIMDAMYSFPALVLAIAIVAMLGPGILNMILAIFVVYIPTYFRVVRGQVLQVREEEFVEAERAAGAGHLRILLRHIAPNTVSSIFAIISFNIADAILTEAGLSFLGLGLPPATGAVWWGGADWGLDIQAGQRFLQGGHWWLITFPGMMIVIVSLGFGLIGEGVSDWINPKRRKRA